MRSISALVITVLFYLVGYGQTFKETSATTIIEHLNSADYYQIMLFHDSATYHAHEAMSLLQNNWSNIDSTLTSRVYAIYGNCMRNGGRYHAEVNMARYNPESRCELLRAFLDTALSYSTSNKQRANIHHKIGTMYSDCVAGYEKDRLLIRLKLSEQSILHLKKALELDSEEAKTVHALIGLNYQYILEHQKAERSYITGLNHISDKNSSEYFALCNWRGGNLEDWYSKTHDLSLLVRADSIYHQSAEIWKANLDTRNQNGTNDGYQISSIGRLVANSIRLYKLTNDTSYLIDAFRWSDLSKYPTFPANRVEIKDVQKLLDDSTVFVQYVFVPRPQRHVAFLIFKNTIEVLEIESFLSMNTERLNNLYGCKNIHAFKKWSNLFYNGYFKQVDSILTAKQISRVVISNSDECSMLNLDVLVSDTTSTTWKGLPYLFHRYNFSYALSARSFVESYSKRSRAKDGLGITVGEYQNETKLRFSEKLTENIKENYRAKRTGISNNLFNHRVSLCLFHGDGSYTQNNAEVLISTSDTLRVNDVYKMNLSNELVLMTACNSNSSRQYYSEGAVGNFSKAFRYSGVQSTLTTSWQIDEKSNAFIVEKLLNYLKDGLPKNDALWKAKQDYWNQCETDEEFNPLYWASYVLTGNVSPVEVQEREMVNKNWLWFLLLIPIGFAGWKKLT